MSYGVSIDTSGFQAHLLRLAHVAREETLPFIAEKNKERILALTASGANYEGEIFHDYGESQRKKREAEGLETDVKDLFFSGGMLGSLAFTSESSLEGILTVGEEYEKIALGQQTGHSGSWGYDHRFIGVSEEGQREALTEWNEALMGRIHG